MPTPKSGTAAKTGATSAPKAAAGSKEKDNRLMAYCMSTKQKEPMDNAVIEKTAKGQYIAKGTATAQKLKVSVILSEQGAKDAVKAGIAEKGW